MINRQIMIKNRYITSVVLFSILFLVVISFSSITASAAPGDETLAAEYAPVFYFEKDETHFPIDALYHIDNSILYEVDDDVPFNTNPTAADLKIITTDGFYLNNEIGTIDSDPSSYSTSGYTETIYFKVHTSASDTIIQYWMFYAFNNGELNQHEGDWEMVQVVLTNGDPKWVAYSQHHSGQWATWDQVEKDGNHIKVYVARGSHANYLRSYSGKLGIASDIVGDNGEVHKSGDYTLADLDNQDWIDYAGRWGEVGQGSIDAAASSSILGRAGPHGPKYREESNMWDNPVSWGKSLPQANDMMFLAEMFVYNFLTIFIIITATILLITILLIVRRHKKYGLGPRIVSILYIDGPNLKSIGNIICIVGIIIAIIGLFNNWYDVSYDFSSSGDLASLETAGWQSLLTIDGFNGIQIVVPGESGPTPVGTFEIPFSLVLGISIIFLIIATIGISRSSKLGFKYIWRGLRLFTPIILILIVMMSLGGLVPEDMTGEEVEGAQADEIFSAISDSPLGNEGSFKFKYTDENEIEKTATMNMKWGLGLGGILLLLAGIIIIVGGVLEIVAKTEFFKPKTPIKKPKKQKKPKKGKQPMPPPITPGPQKPIQKKPIPPPTTSKPPKEKKDEVNFCPECGAKIEKDGAFCPECGKKAK